MRTEVPPPPVARVMQSGGGTGEEGASKITPSEFFSRISAAIDQLCAYARSQVGTDAKQFKCLCHILARGIDFGIANQKVPRRAQDLPSLLKQVYKQNKNDCRLPPTFMVLMMSVKNACQYGWFSDKDSKELMNVFKEIESIFCSVSDLNTDPSTSASVISTIMSRFFPTMKMGHILVFLEAKPGYGTYAIDFHISKNLTSAPGEKVRFFVAQTENIETSSCLVSPPKVSFLLNGNGVDLRNIVSMDTGPQNPAVVNSLLTYGPNLLQAVGNFDGNYIITVALMSDVCGPDGSALQDYEPHVSAVMDSDAEVIEGSSRISLNCPISKKRFKTPVKGYSCKHIQCFDFDNYVDINSRRPNWRCAHCNQPVCFTDIRIDQKMVKILKEVGPHVTDVVFSSDGSWNTAMEIDDVTKTLDEDKNCNSGETSSTQVQDFSLLDAPLEDNILDLTETNDLLDDFFMHETLDRKPNLSDSQSRIFIPNAAAANPSNVNQVRPLVEHASWSRFLSTSGPGSSSGQPHAQTNNSHVTIASAPQRAMLSPNALQFQQHQLSANQGITNEYVRFPSQLQQSRNVTLVHALPVSGQISSVQQLSRLPSYVQGNSPRVSQLPTGLPVPTNSTNHADPNQVLSHISSSQMNPRCLQSQQQSGGHQQAINHPPHPFSSSRSLHERIQIANNRMPPHVLNQSPENNLGMPSQQISHSLVSMRPAGSFSQRSYTLPSGIFSSSQQHSQVAAANRMAEMFIDGTHSIAIDPSRNASTYSMVNSEGRRMMPPVQDQSRVNIEAPPQQLPTRIDPYEPDPSWRPAGRMRGALTGQDYTNALNQYISRPRPTTNPPNLTPRGSSYTPPV